MELIEMDIETTIENKVLTIKFNRAHKKNSITSEMYQLLADALADSNVNPEVRAVVIQGSEEVFSAGNDLADFMERPPTDPDAPVFKFLHEISSTVKPVLAAVSGVAVGIGTTLLVHCDLVYAADNAKFSLPFAQLGLCPEAASSLLLPRICGHQRAAEKLLLGEFFDAKEAMDIGLVNQILPATELHQFVAAQAAKIAALPAESMCITKKLMKATSAIEIANQIKIENENFREMLKGPAAKEAMSAFFEKRKPDFSKLN
jgi:enoyl-CoA hydratase/carnithine racemase